VLYVELDCVIWERAVGEVLVAVVLVCCGCSCVLWLYLCVVVVLVCCGCTCVLWLDLCVVVCIYMFGWELTIEFNCS
jgi:hypothetical protein